MQPRETLERFDHHLTELGLYLNAVIVGGTALSLLDIVTRQTRDCDVISPELPQEIVEAAQSFASKERNEGRDLSDDWLNNGPATLATVLPEGWRGRLRQVFVGKAITLSALGRSDLLKDKLFALCDRGTDLGDCLALAPSEIEVAEALPWLETQDANPDWPAHVRSVLEDLQQRIADGL